MIRLIYNNKAFKILTEFNIDQSNNEVKFNDITIDFTGYDLEDLPLKYQEIQIKKCEDNEDILTSGDVIFFGYVDTIQFNSMKMSNEHRELEITLLSPLKLATLRTTTINGTYNFDTAINLIFEPLINDGFVIQEINVESDQIKVSYIMETIENIMNDLGKKKNIFWWIDNEKNIYVNSINYLFNKNLKKEITNPLNEEGLLNIEPSIVAEDYANTINFKNGRLIYKSDASSVETLSNYDGFPMINLPRNIKTGDVITLNYPFTISKTIAKKICDENGYTSITLFFIMINDSSYAINYNNGNIVIGDNITFENEEGTEGDIVLIKDNFFDNLITSIKWNGANGTITDILSYSALRPIRTQFYYSKEIEKLKNVISLSGKIEKTVDLNEKWYTINELSEYARSLINQNKNNINSVVLEYDVDQELRIGDLVKINLPNFYINDTFAVKEIDFTYYSELEKNWKITLQNSNMITSYIDIFRPENNQENEDTSSIIIAEYIEEEIKEIHNLEEYDES